MIVLTEERNMLLMNKEDATMLWLILSKQGSCVSLRDLILALHSGLEQPDRCERTVDLN